MTRVILFILLAAGASAQGDAIAAYARGDYAVAAALYSALPNAETDAGVLANRGNCAFRLGRFAEALVFFRRAEMREPENADIVFNRRRTESRLGLDPVDTDARITWDSALRLLGHPSIVVVCVIFECIGLWLAFYGRRRSAIMGLILAGAALLIGIGGTSAQMWPRQPQAIVLASDTVVRADPHRDHRSLVVLAAGESVEVEMLSDRWMKISHRRGAGWIEREAAALVD